MFCTLLYARAYGESFDVCGRQCIHKNDRANGLETAFHGHCISRS